MSIQLMNGENVVHIHYVIQLLKKKKKTTNDETMTFGNNWIEIEKSKLNKARP